MGNEVDVGMRGDLNVVLTEYINKCSDDEFDKVLVQLNRDGTIDPAKVTNKFNLIDAMNSPAGSEDHISDADKESILEKIQGRNFYSN